MGANETILNAIVRQRSLTEGREVALELEGFPLRRVFSGVVGRFYHFLGTSACRSSQSSLPWRSSRGTVGVQGLLFLCINPLHNQVLWSTDPDLLLDAIIIIGITPFKLLEGRSGNVIGYPDAELALRIDMVYVPRGDRVALKAPKGALVPHALIKHLNRPPRQRFVDSENHLRRKIEVVTRWP